MSDCFLPRVGGIEQQVQGLAARQLAAGHDVRVVTCVAGRGAGHFVERRVVRPPGRVNDDRIRYETSWRQRRAVVAGDRDLVHIHASTWSPLGFLAAAAAVRAGIPTVVTAHSMLSGIEALFAAGGLVFGWPRWPIAWSAVSTIAAEPLRRLVGPSVPVAVLPNGVDPDSWRVPQREPRPGGLRVMTVGRLAARKRPRQLLRILRAARAAVPREVRLEAVLVGDGPLRPALQRYLDATEMNDWVRLAGSADQEGVRRHHAEADVYVAPAHLESFGIAALEARCAGLPVVAHARSGISDFIVDGVDGLLTHGDADMAQRIVQLATDPALLRRLQRHNGRTVPGIDWSAVLEQHEVVYEHARAIAGRPSRLAAGVR